VGSQETSKVRESVDNNVLFKRIETNISARLSKLSRRYETDILWNYLLYMHRSFEGKSQAQ
jgi:hypothetical protein